MCPSTSWVAKWNDKSPYIPGVYALKVNDSEKMEDDNDIYERVQRTKDEDDESMDEGGNEVMQRKKRGNLKRIRSTNPEWIVS